MPRRLTPLENPVSIEVDGQDIPAREGEPLACALLAAGKTIFSRSTKYHRPRGLFCMAGSCAHCCMCVDGTPSVPACQVPVRPGMRVTRQNAWPHARLDFLRAADFVFSAGFNHHEFLAGVPIAEKVLQHMARQLAGLGLVPSTPAPQRLPAQVEWQDTVIVGAGPAGLAAAQRLEEAGMPYTLLERDTQPGGQLLLGLEADIPMRWQPSADCLRLGALLVGLYADRGQPFLAVLQNGHMHFLFYRTLLLAHGAHALLPAFVNNDLPGVMAYRAVAALIHRYQLLPGQHIACVGETQRATALARVVTQAGARALAVGGQLSSVHGRTGVRGVTVRGAGAGTEAKGQQRLPCEVVALCTAPAASFEFARLAGARVRWDEKAHSCVVDADGRGRTVNPTLLVAGELTGPMSAATAATRGREAATALAAGAL